MESYRFLVNKNLEQKLIEVLDNKIDYLTLKKWMDENDDFNEYHVKESIIVRFIYYTLINKKIRIVLGDVVDHLSSHSITRTVFYMLFYYPDDSARTDILIILAHMNLTIYQLELLCETELTFECFYTLGEKLYLDEKISVNKFDNFMKFFYHSKFKEHITIFYNNFIKKDLNQEKDIIIEKYLL